MVLLVAFVLQESVIRDGTSAQGEATDAQDEVHVHLAVCGAVGRSDSTDDTNQPLHFYKFLMVYNQIAHAQQEPVRELDLLHRLIPDDLRLLVVEMLCDTLCLNQRKDPVKTELLLHVLIRAEAHADVHVTLRTRPSWQQSVAAHGRVQC